MPVPISCRDLPTHVGTTFASPDPVVVTAEMVRGFADLTAADGWMHVDAERAAASPLGRATVQGLLTLSLGTLLEKRVWSVVASDAVFYGFDRIRFPAPLFVGDELRLEIEVTAAEVVDDVVHARLLHRFTSAGPKPVCVAEQIVRYTP